MFWKVARVSSITVATKPLKSSTHNVKVIYANFQTTWDEFLNCLIETVLNSCIILLFVATSYQCISPFLKGSVRFSSNPFLLYVVLHRPKNCVCSSAKTQKVRNIDVTLLRLTHSLKAKQVLTLTKSFVRIRSIRYVDEIQRCEIIKQKQNR